jgi:hypothetical protein
MPADFSPIVTEVTELTTVVDSAVAFIDGADEKLAEAIAADNLSDNSNVAQFAAELRAQKTKIAEAIARNTAAAEEPPAEDGGGA